MSYVATLVAMISFAANEDAEFDPTTVTPGVLGFGVTAVFAVAVIFLGFDLVRRLRRSRFRAEIQEELAAEIAERDANTGSSGQSRPEADASTRE